jgi:hypothetical protein
MDEFYKSRHIRTALRLDLDSDCWVPTADVSWNDHGRERHELLAGPPDFFKVLDEAEIYAVDMAKAWVDAQSLNHLSR